MSQHHPFENATTRTMMGLGQPRETRSATTPPDRLGAGVGATGQLFEANGAAGLGPLVIKRFNWGAGLEAGVVQDFTRQALEVAKLRHPHVVQVVDAGSLPDGTPFVVMERLSGATLEERASGALIPLSDLLPILRGVASGLAAAHAVGVAHRELRADNVFMADVAGYAHGFPKLLDFGVAGLTAAACARGHDVAESSLDAVPPEQRLNLAGGDARSDQFALAALAYRFLAGADVTPAVELVLTRAMNWHPARRFDSVASFIEALEEAARAVPEVTLPRAAAEAVREPQAEGAAPSPPEAGSLTQQFFAEGDRLEQATRLEASGSLTATADSAAGDVTLSVPRVPRSRGPILMAISLALTSLAIVGWTTMSLSDIPRWPGPTSAEAPQPPLAAAPDTTAPIPTAPVPAARTASMALRAAPPVRAVARPGLPPTEPPPVPAPPSLTPPASTPPASVPTAAAAAAPPPAATAAVEPTLPLPPPLADEPTTTAPTPVAPIDEGRTPPWEQPASEPYAEPTATEPSAP